MKKNDKKILHNITERLEQGIKDFFQSEKYMCYLKTMAQFHNYSFNNTLLIAMQKPDATLVAGYQTWKNKFERHVRKGEKGIQILAPVKEKMMREVEKHDSITHEPVLKSDGTPEIETIEMNIQHFRVVTVFDVSQTEGKPLPEIIAEELSGKVTDYELFIEAIKRGSPVPIRFDEIEGGVKGYYHNVNKEIVVQNNMSESQTMKTTIHEVAHAMLHDRDYLEMNGKKKDRMTKEVEAESVDYTVCQYYGLDTSEYSFPYIASWSSNKELQELVTSMETIRNTASMFIDSMRENLRILGKEKANRIEMKGNNYSSIIEQLEINNKKETNRKEMLRDMKKSLGNMR